MVREQRVLDAGAALIENGDMFLFAATFAGWAANGEWDDDCDNEKKHVPVFCFPY
jgi:hypothetical protein